MNRHLAHEKGRRIAMRIAFEIGNSEGLKIESFITRVFEHEQYQKAEEKFICLLPMGQSHLFETLKSAFTAGTFKGISQAFSKISASTEFTDFENNAYKVRIQELWWQKNGLMFSGNGYGKKIPTRYVLLDGNRWKRVYCHIFSNSGTCYFIRNHKRINLIE